MQIYTYITSVPEKVAVARRKYNELHGEINRIQLVGVSCKWFIKKGSQFVQSSGSWTCALEGINGES